jgi:MFS family permease
VRRAASPRRLRSSLVVFASAVVLVDTSFYAAITPLLPDLTSQFHLSKGGAGLLAAAYPAGTFVGGLPGGWLAAKVGVKPTVVLGLALMTVASVGFAFGESILALDIARFVQGLGGAASWAGAMAWLTAGAPRDRRGALIGSAMGAAIAGALLGPVVGVAADLAGHAAVFCAIGGLGIALIAWAAELPAARPNADATLRGLVASLADGRVRGGVLLITLPGLLFGTVAVLGPLRMHDLGASAAAIGATWLVAAGFEAIVSPLAGRFSDRHGRTGPLLAGLAAGCVTFALLPWPGTAWLLAVLIIAGTPAVGLLWAPSMAMLSDGAEAIGLEQGLAFGLMNLTWATGQTIGDLGGARLGQAAGDTVPYLLLAGLCAACFVFLRTRVARPATV